MYGVPLNRAVMAFLKLTRTFSHKGGPAGSPPGLDHQQFIRRVDSAAAGLPGRRFVEWDQGTSKLISTNPLAFRTSDFVIAAPPGGVSVMYSVAALPVHL